jgi:predicted dehydrogenase
MKKFRWAIFGIGKFSPMRGGANAIAYAHAEGMKRNSDMFEIAAAASRSKENLEAFRNEYPCNTYSSIDELLANEKIDGVSICTYAADREKHVLAAINAGVKFVMIEKPLALTMREADNIRQAAEKNGVRLFVNFQRRYGQPFEWAKEACQSGKLGRISLVEMRQPGSNMLDFGPHLINSALYCLNDPEPLYAMAAQEGQGTFEWHGMLSEKYTELNVDFENGLRFYFTGSPQHGIDLPSIRICGDKGFAELYLDKKDGMKSVFRCVTAVGIENPESTENFHHGDVDKYLYFERCYRDLGSCITGNTACRIDFGHGYLTQRIMLAGYASAQKNKRIIFNENEEDPTFRFYV